MIPIYLNYFNPSGAWVASASMYFEPKREGHELMDAVAKIRGMLACGGQGGLPGLPDGWDGPVLVRVKGQVRLILPQRKDG